MPYLDTALAFALTMLAVATLVTQLVRFFHNLAGIRNETMKDMLQEYFKEELQPIVDRELSRLKKEVPEDIAESIEKKADELGKKLPFTQKELAKLTEVSADELVERLKRSDMGKEFLEALGDKAKTVFDEFAKRYEILGIKFTKSYRSNARVWATVIALVLAFALNIDSVFIVNTYLTNQEMRQAVIGQESAIVDGYSAVAEQFEADTTKESITKEEFENAFADAQEELNTFTSAGFPIGWSYFPHTALQDKPTNDFDNRNTPLGWLTWVTGCVLTGLLAGLGGPFWYDFVAGVSHAAKSLRDQKG